MRLAPYPSGKSSILKFRFRSFAAIGERAFPQAQFDPPDLARHRLRQLKELDPTHQLVSREAPAHVLEDRRRRRAVRGMALGKGDIAFGDRVAHRIGRRHDGGFGDRGMFDQHAFKLEWA